MDFKNYWNKLKTFIDRYGLVIVCLILVIEIILIVLVNPFSYLPLETKEDTLFNVNINSDEYYSIDLELKKSYLLPYGNLFIKFDSDRPVDIYIFDRNQYVNYLEIKNGDKIGQIYYLNRISGAFFGNLSYIFSTFGKFVYIVIETFTYPVTITISYRMIVFDRFDFMMILIFAVILIGIAIGLIIYINKLKKDKNELERPNFSF